MTIITTDGVQIAGVSRITFWSHKDIVLHTDRPYLTYFHHLKQKSDKNARVVGTMMLSSVKEIIP